MSEILDVDLLAFERGSGEQRRAVVDGVRRSLETGFVYTRHDLSEDLLDTAYGMLVEFFKAPADEKQRWVQPGANGQTGYTGLLVETAASSDVPDWKEMLNWSTPIPAGHPLKRRFPHVVVIVLDAPWAALAFATAPVAIVLVRRVGRATAPPQLVAVLVATARLELVTSLLLAVGLWIG